MATFDYRSSGVNIDEGNRFVELIKSMVNSTKTPEVIGGIGGFAGFFDISAAKGMEHPVLVSSTDGVGTKLKVAFMAEKFDTVGIDLVAMCVNDLIVTGAKPLFFLDYIATGKLEPEVMANVVKGITDGCIQAGSALVGGETAEMPGIYAEGEFDLAGFSVGILDKPKAIDGSKIKPGDKVIGIASTGFHSNGYSLLRKVFFEKLNMKPTDVLFDGKTVADVLLSPTRIYVKMVLDILEKGIPVHGMVNITGGGFYENIIRVFPEGVNAVIDKKSFPILKEAQHIIDNIDIEERELYRVLNMGIGYVMIVPAGVENDVIATAKTHGDAAYVIGEITEGTGIVEIIGIDR